MRAFALAVVVVLVVLAGSAHAVPMWGPIGHSVVASVAQTLLSDTATTQVNTILNGATLASVSSWADTIKSQPGWTWSAVLHYINTPDWACNFQYSRDCVNDICVAGAIFNYTKQLQTSSDPDTLDIALKFVDHFVGDIHQPLHVGFTSDEGGNDIKGTFFGYNDNLHAIWDTYIILDHIDNDFNGDQDQYTSYIISQVQGPWAQQALQWAVCADGSIVCPDAWAMESVGLACTNAYVTSNGTHIQNGFDLGQDYYDTNYPVIDMQLGKAGVRLAATLNNIFTSA